MIKENISETVLWYFNNEVPISCWAKKDVKKNSNAYDKNRTQDNIKHQIQHEESWPGWIVIEQINYK